MLNVDRKLYMLFRLKESGLIMLSPLTIIPTIWPTGHNYPIRDTMGDIENNPLSLDF